MENAKHIGGMATLAVALGVGLATANTPAVAWAAPADSGKGASSDGSSQSSSPKHSGSTSSDTRSTKHGSSEKRDAPKRDRRTPKPSDETAVSTSDSRDDAPTESSGSPPAPATKRAETRQRGGDNSRPESAVTTAKTSPKLAVVSAAADPATPSSSLDLTRASSTSLVNTPANLVTTFVSSLVNAVVSPFAGSAPNRSPVQNPAEFMLLAFARREFEPRTTVDQQTAAVTTTAADPGFISSTHGFFGLFSVTSAADPDDNHYVAFVLRTPFFTNVLTSGTDPEDNLGFGAASIGVAGHTVNTFISPFLNFSIAIPIEDPFAELFTELVRLGF